MATPDTPHFCNVFSLVPEGVKTLAHFFTESIHPGHAEEKFLPALEEIEGLQPRFEGDLTDETVQALADAAMRHAEINHQRPYLGRF